MNYYIYETKIGHISIAAHSDKITMIKIVGSDENFLGTKRETPTILKAKDELLRYLAGELQCFSVALDVKGTPFQQKVWQALLEIPYGETRSYGEIAKAIGNTKACRAVGMANNKNPIMIMIPCHRVIGANRSLTGYAGGLEVKQLLLDIEKNNKIHDTQKALFK